MPFLGKGIPRESTWMHIPALHFIAVWALGYLTLPKPLVPPCITGITRSHTHPATIKLDLILVSFKINTNVEIPGWPEASCHAISSSARTIFSPLLAMWMMFSFLWMRLISFWGSGHSRLLPANSICWASQVAQTVRNLPAMWETQVQSLGLEDPLEKELATHSSLLAWEIPWTGSLAGYSQQGRQGLDTTEQMTL